MALGANDLLHHREDDHSRALGEVVALLKAKFPKAKLGFLQPFNCPKFERMRVPLDEFRGILNQQQVDVVYPPLASDGLTFDSSGVHLTPESHLSLRAHVKDCLLGKPTQGETISEKDFSTLVKTLFRGIGAR